MKTGTEFFGAGTHMGISRIGRLFGTSLVWPLLIAQVQAAEPVIPPIAQVAIANGSLTLHRTGAGIANKDGKYEAKSTDGHFSVMMPLPFNDFTMRDPENPQGPPMMFGIGGKSSEGIQFSVVEGPVQPGKQPFDNLDQVRQDFVEETKKQPRRSLFFSRVYDDRLFEFNGHAAVELKIADKPNGAIVRHVYLKDRLFIMIAEYPIQHHQTVLPIAKTWMDSLKIDASSEKARDDKSTRP